MDGPASAPKLLRWIVWAALAAYGGLFAYLGWRHIGYAGFLEPLESDVLRHIQLISEGRAPYPPASADFIGATLMPLYYYMSAPFYALLGDSFAGPRLVSVVAALASGALVGWIASRESGERWVGALAAALFFSGYRLMDACLTCAQPDALALFLVLSGYCAWAYGRRPVHDLLWVLLLGLAAWTKLQAAMQLGALVAIRLVGGTRPGRLPKWALVVAALLVGPAAYRLLAPHLGPAFLEDAVWVPARWERSVRFSALRTTFVFACFVPFATWLTVAWLRRVWRVPGAARGRWPALLGLNFALSALSTSVAGSSNNHYVPLLAVLCVTAALGAREIARGEGGWTAGAWVALPLAAFAISSRLLAGHASQITPLATRVGVAAAFGLAGLAGLRVGGAARASGVAALLVVAQLAAGFYPPARFLPDPAFEAERKALQAELAGLEGPVVWWPYGNVPARLTGRKLAQAPSDMAVEDVRRQEHSDARIEYALSPLRARLAGVDPLWVLANAPLEEADGWGIFAGQFVRVRDYGTRFRAVRQAAAHWFGGGGYPRYLYRLKSAEPPED